MNPDLEEAARLYEEAAAELDRAARHCKVSAGRFRDGEVPSGTAHAWAALGHIRKPKNASTLRRGSTGRRPN